ncbi:MAG: hypothetical protein O3B02_03625 [Proteobacteria bacterium]|nr:hypothetical protein [Pseudomonadota bacterium]
MKKTLLLAAALACSGAVAQEKEIWACQEIQSYGMEWTNGRWQGGAFEESQLLFTLNGINSTLKLPELPRPIDLSCLYDVTDGYWFCSDPLYAVSFIINQDSGSAGYSTLFGAVINEEDRSSITVSVLQCTKF